MRRTFVLLAIAGMTSLAPVVVRAPARAESALPELSPPPASSRFT